MTQTKSIIILKFSQPDKPFRMNFSVVPNRNPRPCWQSNKVKQSESSNIPIRMRRHRL